MSPSDNYKKRQSSIIFAKGTKRYDGTNAIEGTNPPAGNNTRDSQAWAGMMMGNLDSDDESDSDRSDIDDLRDRKPVPAASNPPSSSANRGNNGGVRASWTTRAAAVGSRPPDTASQNPPSLKLLGLKSVKDGGIPLGSNGNSTNTNQSPLSPALSMRQEIERRQMEEQQQQRQVQQLRVEEQREAVMRDRTPSPAFEMVDEERRQLQYSQQQQQQGVNNLRVTSNSDYGEEADRHGSMIDFGGTDGFGSMDKMGNQQIQNAPKSNRGVELQDEPVRYNQPPQSSRQQANLGPPRDPFANQPTSPRTALTQELGLGTRSPSPYHQGNGMQNPQYQQQGQQRNLVSPFQDPRPNQIPPRSESASSAIQQSRNPMGPTSQQQQGLGNGQNGEIPLRRGPPPPLSLMPGGQMNNNNMSVPSGPSRGVPPSPHPIPLPSPVHYPGQPNMQQRNGPSPNPGPPNGGPGGYQGMPPGPQQQQQQQGGSMPRQQQGFSDAQGGPRNNPPARRPSLFRRSKAFLTGSNVGPNQQQQQQQQQQRKSLFRKSMALFTGRSNENGQMQHQNLDNGEDDSNAPAPRVQGFVDEKPKDRKSHYMGGGGMGDEWDYSGNGARFWKRFSIAQHKLQAGDFADSEEKRLKLARRKKITMFATLIGGLCIILAVVAVVIWRESTPTSDVPGAIDRSKGGAGTDLGEQLSSQNAAAVGTQTASAGSSAATSTSRSVATQDDGSSGSGSDTTGTTTTTTKKKNKKGKKHRKNDGDTRRSIIDDGKSSKDISEVVKRQVEEIIPSSSRMLAIEQIASSHATTSMIRRRRQLVEAKQD